METWKNFEWYRNAAGHRLAWMPQRGKHAFWINEPSDSWSGGHTIDRSAKLEISKGGSEKPVARRGIYLAHTVQIFNRGKPDELAKFELVRPFESNELVSLNLLETGDSPQGWLNFANKYGPLGHQPVLDRSHLIG